MLDWKRTISTALVFCVLGVGCAPAGPGDSSRAVGSSPPSSAAPLKRITLGTALEQGFGPTAAGQRRIVAPLVYAGLTALGDQRVRHPLLAEALPSLENGLWTLLPDGRMETTWKLRERARWHDGAPVTAEDLLFTLEVGRDREMSAFNIQAYASIEEVRSSDPGTVTIAWKEPFIAADTLLDNRPLGLLPRHLLEEAYRSDKATLLDLPYWTHEFVGTGPYRLRELAPGIGMLLGANPDYVLGRPKIDEIEVQYILDANTMTAYLLSGRVDVALLESVELGVQVRDQWRGGTVVFNHGADSWNALFPQFVDPRPAAIADVQVRRALAHAIDRQEIVDTLAWGMSPVAHSLMSPNQPAYREIEAAVPRYDFDPRRAAELLEARGYRKGADGIYRDEANRRLELEVHSSPLERAAKPASAIADYWQRLGVDATAVRFSPQQVQDFQLVATFPAVAVWNRANDLMALRNLHSAETRLPSNNFRVTGAGNTSRYMNPEVDGLLETYLKTVPMPERIQVLGQIIRHIADQVVILGLYYQPSPGAVSHRVVTVGTEWSGAHITWNAHEWDVQG